MDELYRELIIDHGRRPRNFHALDSATHHKEGFNPLCGDKLTVYLQVENDKISEVSFQGSGCAISLASASMMTEVLKGKTLTEAETIFQQFHQLVTQAPSENQVLSLGKLAVLGGVSQYPARVKCATLCWHTTMAALHNNPEPVSTES